MKILKYSSADMPVVALGSGYSDDKQMAAAVNCFAPGNITYAGGGKSTINFGNAISFYEFQTSLNVDVSGSISIGMFSANFAADYARYTQVERYSQSFYYMQSIKLPTAIWQPGGYGIDALNEIGKEAYQRGPQYFRDVCGNELVQEVDLGANLAASMKLNFQSAYDCETFKANAGVSWGSIVSALSTIKQMVSTYGLSGSLEFSAFQSGGDPSQLARLFNSPKGSYYLSACSLNNLDACGSIIDSVLNYAATDFPNQIDFKNGTVLGAATPTGWIMLDLSALGLNAGQSVLTPEIIAARAALGDLYKTQQANSTFVQHLLNSSFVEKMSPDTIRNLRIANNALNINVALLSNTTPTSPLGCYMEPVQCPAIKQNLLAQIMPVDIAFLNQMNRGFMVAGQLLVCDCHAGCVGFVAGVSSALFPTDTNSSFYYTAKSPSAPANIVLSGDVLSITVGGEACPSASKITGYNRYEFSSCAGGLDCMKALGGYAYTQSCGTPVSCTGEVEFIVSENPL